jgi:hypothetical protein
MRHCIHVLTESVAHRIASAAVGQACAGGWLAFDAVGDVEEQAAKRIAAVRSAQSPRIPARTREF